MDEVFGWAGLALVKQGGAMLLPALFLFNS